MYLTQGSSDGHPVKVTDRWLTPDVKRKILAEWGVKKQQALPDGDLAGRGFPDPEIIPWCDRLNKIEGVCTLQSCAGHEMGSVEGGWGHLWLWLSEPISRAFDSRAFELASYPHIDRVERIYGSWGQEVASITFAGDERGLLAESGALILRFLGSLDG